MSRKQKDTCIPALLQAGMSAYVQTDPRGCALYVLRAGDIPEGQDPSRYYSRGLPVYK